MDFVEILLRILHIFVCAVLMFVVLLQQGKGGGLGAAFGGAAAAQVFGGRGAGNILTRATAICATIFMLTSVGLAYKSSAGDRSLKAKAAEQAKENKNKGAARPKSEAPKEPGKDDKTGAGGDKAPEPPKDTPAP
jgi:preprotein translocase subunit SecG